MTLANLAVERVLERAAQDRGRPGRHTLVMGGSAEERRSVLDRIEARLRHGSPGAPPHVGRVRGPFDVNAAGGANAMWEKAAEAAGLNETDHLHTSGFGRIQNAAGERRFVAIIDDLDAVLDGWDDPGEALNLRWALQNVNGLTVVAAAEGPVGQDGPHEHAILAMTFSTQYLGTAAAQPRPNRAETGRSSGRDPALIPTRGKEDGTCTATSPIGGHRCCSSSRSSSWC